MRDDEPCYEIQCLQNPVRYSGRQIRRAALLAAFLGRGKLVLVEPPEGEDHP